MLNHEAARTLKQKLPLSMVATKRWLQEQGLSLHYIDNSVRRGALAVAAPGVYYREETPPTWLGVVASLQRMVRSPVHMGGLSALALHGVSHYVNRSGKPIVDLYSPDKLPAWINKVDVDASFEWHGTKRLWPESLMRDQRVLRPYEWSKGLPEVTYSCVEKAYLEVLNEVPKHISFEHADALLQGLHNLSPRKLDTLLKNCLNVKVKRLFFWLAERNQQPWFKRLVPTDYDLGSGKRAIAVNGRLESKWQITVPKEM
ncbi:type IV toxin-antitoxin system AbiEi family antitoxin domain-containing protein [Idiomarina abyssalis]|uniref:type IV toxin-antitoxin system AbiEi family antitoxin domain-containing protein n=1 Tax=Idiomarina abyssalis TaxID=86102 RepID=UPI0006C8A650|nr:type IV toxin-antitoxin system AbiEi family antitoxin domain-containing protein [Idiomarina abyssalis]KPD21915.1 hypothetical protein ADS78_05545 [Idiomarina abyssalis]SFT65902.1 Transcriptional regulator, AbiEi antitoxin, Type IV TA system [Idiomarina abyssalis]